MSTVTDINELNSLAGSREDGYTSEDVASTCMHLRSLLGYDWVVVWHYFDMYGCGGNSESFLRDGQGKLYEQPGFLYELLFDGIEVTRERVEQEMSDLQPVRLDGWHDFDDVEKLVEVDFANYALQVTSGNGKWL